MGKNSSLGPRRDLWDVNACARLSPGQDWSADKVDDLFGARDLFQPSRPITPAFDSILFVSTYSGPGQEPPGGLRGSVRIGSPLLVEPCCDW